MPPPKCDTNPLTILVHMYYINSRLASHTTQPPKGGPNTRGTPPDPRGLNVQAHPKGQPTRCPTAQAKAAISSSIGSGSPFPHSLHSPSVIPEKSGIQGAQGDCIKGDRSIHSADRMTPMENRLERRPALLEFGAKARGCPEDIRSCPFPANLDTIS